MIVLNLNKFIHIVLCCLSIWAAVSTATFGPSHNIRMEYYVPNNLRGQAEAAWTKVLDFYEKLGDSETHSKNGPFSRLRGRFQVMGRDTGGNLERIDSYLPPFRKPMAGLDQHLTHAIYVLVLEDEKPDTFEIHVRGEVPDQVKGGKVEWLSHQAVFRFSTYFDRIKFEQITILHGLSQEECRHGDFFTQIGESLLNEATTDDS
ncbi:uncharacterized protein MELLADRAFT_101611 [Melampsora larici-populina 98AG31]|uniref:Secreted protein n=1 Tax=Melampsora larici-populina (strain 98AG31 / pathotype 3-4-7) TaxID=747676 RepID=F4R6E5_MELLP|nr:uncharacterized protein MELLADRAFT_101611 [Melampsora larici-populina 98AG31]EGG11864.1 secreted protein [Melampsora larici-populina 98AG31]